MKTIFRIVPFSVCLTTALVLPSCDRTDAPVTSVTPAASKGEAAPADAAVAAPAATPPAPTKADATGARPGTSGLLSNATDSTSLTAEAPAAQKTGAATQNPISTTQIVKADPSEVDIGDIPTNDSKNGTVRLVNTGDTPMTVVTARASCGCTALEFSPNTVIPAKETLEVAVKMNGGTKDGPITGKTITFVVDGQPEVIVPIKANAVSFVKADPPALFPDTMPDGTFTLKSIDGQSFTVKSTIPQVVENLSTEPAVEQKLTVSWEKYREIGLSRQMIVYLDHPKCGQVFVPVNFNAEEMRKFQEEQRAQRDTNRQAIASTGTKADALNATATKTPAAIDPDQELANLIKAKSNVEVLQKIQAGLDVNYRDNTGASLLSLAAKEGNVELVKSLLAIESVDRNSTDNIGRTALMHAAGSKNAEAVRVLLDADLNPDTRDNLGTTALSWAAWIGDVESVHALLEAGSAVEVVSTITGWTPLILAAGFGETESVAALLDAHAEIEAADMLEGATPLIHASRTGKPETIKLLVQRGANLENPDRNGCTPLLACSKTAGGDAVKVKTLIELGADIHAKDNRGYNALELAKKRTDIRAAEVIKILEPLLASETPAAASGEKDPAAGS